MIYNYITVIISLIIITVTIAVIVRYTLVMMRVLAVIIIYY